VTRLEEILDRWARQLRFEKVEPIEREVIRLLRAQILDLEKRVSELEQAGRFRNILP
jgi:hypothetical protein